jgi:hypothetical protein
VSKLQDDAQTPDVFSGITSLADNPDAESDAEGEAANRDESTAIDNSMYVQQQGDGVQDVAAAADASDRLETDELTLAVDEVLGSDQLWELI